MILVSRKVCQGNPRCRRPIRMLRRTLLSGLVVLAWLSVACASKEEVIPIIHVSPGFESRLALRPPAAVATPAAPVAPAASGDGGAADPEPTTEK